MHNVDLEKIAQTVEAGRRDPDAVKQPVDLAGEWNSAGDGPQFRGSIPYPTGEVAFTCDFPPALGGAGSAPNPLAYCLWGGLACYAMTFATEAAREGVELRGLHGRITTVVDLARALGLSEQPPVDQITWALEVDADVSAETVDRIKTLADQRCPGVYCIQNPIPLETRASISGVARR
jgi:uncharacterized OsmC-like protein